MSTNIVGVPYNAVHLKKEIALDNRAKHISHQ